MFNLLGADPDESRGTRINLTLSEENQFYLWAAQILDITEHTVNRQENVITNETKSNKPNNKKKKKKNVVEEEIEGDCTYWEIKLRLFTPLRPVLWPNGH